MLQFCKSHIKPYIDYGLIVYGAWAKTHMQKIETTQNDIIRLIFGLKETNKHQVSAYREWSINNKRKKKISFD